MLILEKKNTLNSCFGGLSSNLWLAITINKKNTILLNEPFKI